MKYLRKFETEADKNAWLGGSEHVTPNVVLTEGKVGYNEKIDYSLLPLHFNAIESLTIKFNKSCQYSKNGTNWYSATASKSISVSAGEKVYFRASGLTPSSSSGIGTFFIYNGTCNVAGNIMSMVYGANFVGKTELEQYQFVRLFEDATKINAADNLILPATTLSSYCYNSMFNGCTSLITAPKLPATIMQPFCYDSMFSGCTSLVNAPELPATTLNSYCYNLMFNGCTSLVTAPVLPATSLASSCYSAMFNGCTSLNYIKAMFTTSPNDINTPNWVSGVSSSGTFVKNSAATWEVTGANGIPEGWTVETADA